ncbi:DUF2155 domain-containing protein [Rhizobiales bacterium L72]|uniref:DUF2155 domain-containing protein n=1 Tax=Propylenella binzhouense TaxID=2555902 RepID=A0A964WV52_9HYPH|nr:DUF2155 domain-containing protein [Propylenella binzhouense]
MLRPRALLLASSLALLLAGPAAAEPIANPVATFSGLDKITGRIIQFDAKIDETVQFGALQVTPRACHTRPPTEPAQTTAFVEVDEITLENEIRRIFTGWMFAASPGLHGVEHPIYDVWLVDCRQDVRTQEQIRKEEQATPELEAPGGGEQPQPSPDQPPPED